MDGKISKELAIAGFVLSILPLIAMGGWAIGTWEFSLPNLDISQRLRFFATFATIIAGVVTFLTVCWRAIISEEQNAISQKQIDAQLDTINLTREANLGDTFVKASEILDSAKSENDYRTGVSLLSIVISSKHSHFSKESTIILSKILSDQINSLAFEEYNTSNRYHLLDQIFNTLDIAAQHNIFNEHAFIAITKTSTIPHENITHTRYQLPPVNHIHHTLNV